ncbi:carbon-nitrogen family hydrolase [Heyndrickxia sporothermodurans]|uniref:Carbon-nitrogen family hydrolase n=1 Tax=Heyndrickxia sporothermodurans TaxID=46224 RepID=A0AB37HJD1_9BACI|nr:carbon-nitrogen family hydrolase [Heyndrickxia sporothermodurans]MBL5782114.1 carbon-nitrogen family hydrolase [Heyndrickxia sporothermodurans]MBL5796424.1 carbon-nitrogen family hydrolase [Heyndrickxia sporothermodurans]MBL5803856.1 carbon-nitrogen family hydrolase [Heyndrickxia sporothermodurans]MBL5807437.1 carbon-nitrogen family hydrolase [Heyndrickxia sporothermodurans]MBL5832030.1 carbon-nitrogen family hydrolase [Heyndrickxia sporothermodurans]
MKISIYQMEIIPGNPMENMKKVRAWIEKEVKNSGPDVIVLPEMWTTSYTLEDIHHYADDNGQTIIPFLQTMAQTFNINIIGGSFANKVNGKIFNTAVVINRQGEAIYQYDKVHLVPMLNEPKYLEGGRIVPEVFELDGIKMGLIICYDLRFPEVIRPLALEGAEVLFIVAEWPIERLNHWRNIQITRAIENQLFVVSCNNVGSYQSTTFAGNSMVVNPSGDTLIEGSTTVEETLYISINIEETLEVRQKVPVFSSRVPNLYKQGL